MMLMLYDDDDDDNVDNDDNDDNDDSTIFSIFASIFDITLFDEVIFKLIFCALNDKYFSYQ